ncbi:hypothetical protein K502DRAFT_345356 [Neoconidiobolus thromboides FSU 785]|nr:hypothetical protein K502DRAFT_345356 [Neoconidiobolus thromboides FSU 785]
MQLKYLSFFMLPLIAFGADIAPPADAAQAQPVAPADPVPVQPAPEEAPETVKDETPKKIEQTKCKGAKSAIISEPGIAVLSKDVNMSLAIANLKCSSGKVVTGSITAHGPASCSVPTRIGGSVTLMVDGVENKGNGTLSIDLYSSSFKGIINSGPNAGQKVELKARVSDLLLGRGAQCVSTAGLNKFNLVINSLQF